MVLQAIAFYLLAATTLVAGLAVISARNPVHSVLFLITSLLLGGGTVRPARAPSSWR